MKQIKAKALLKIKEGKLDAFKNLVPQFISTVKEKDPGTLNYDWYLNEKNLECTVLETYTDSDALLTHVAHVGELLQKLSELSEIRLEVYGNPSKQLLAAVEGMGTKIFPYYSGL